MDSFVWIGLLDYWICHPIWALLWCIPRGTLFLFLFPNLGSVVADASQGRFVFFVFCNLAQKGNIWSKKVICGSDFWKNDYIWSDVIKFGRECDGVEEKARPFSHQTKRA